VYAQ
jgi:hypothetical protein